MKLPVIILALLFPVILTAQNVSSELIRSYVGNYAYGTDEVIYMELDDGDSMEMCSYGSLYLITNKEDQLEFSLSVCNATYHVGEVEGVLTFENDTLARYNLESEEEWESCELVFHFRENGVFVDEISCQGYHGARASFWGTFERELYTPASLKKQILNCDNKFELHEMLEGMGMISKNEDDNTFTDEEYSVITYDDMQENEILLNPEGLAVDVFYKNVFGDDTKEAIVQLRFHQIIYYVNCFYKENGMWKKVPGYIHMNGESNGSEGRPWSSSEETGYFVFQFDEARKQGEYLISGITYSGATRSNYIQYYVWQITSAGFHQLHEGVKDVMHYNHFGSTRGEYQYTLDYEFVSTKGAAFPKILKCTGHLRDVSFSLSDEEMDNDDDRGMLEPGKNGYDTNIDKAVRQNVLLQYVGER
jgi:hypothetical protein